MFTAYRVTTQREMVIVGKVKDGILKINDARSVPGKDVSH